MERIPGFADKARIRHSPETEALGFAGLDGVVFGHTRPSSSQVEGVIGELEDDFAINVMLDGLDEQFWFAAHLVEFVAHSPGASVSFDGSDDVHIQEADGSWTSMSKDAMARAEAKANAPLAPLLRWLERFLPKFY
jgi:hypothetical protein